MRIKLTPILALFGVIILTGISGAEAFGQVNIALKANNPNVTAYQSSTNNWEFRQAGPATKAIDGDLAGGLGDQRIVETRPEDNNAYFQVNLGDYYKINKITIRPRTDCCQGGFKSVNVIVTDQPLEDEQRVVDSKISLSSTYSTFLAGSIEKATDIDTRGAVGKYVRLQIKGSGQIELAELEIYGEKAPAGYAATTTKAWAAAPKKLVAVTKPKPANLWNVAFDPYFPNYRGETGGGYFDTLKSAPKIVGVTNPDNTIDIAFQDNSVINGAVSNKIFVNTYKKAGNAFAKTATMNVESGGAFGGFAKDAGGNRYIFTSDRWNNWADPVGAKIYKNNEEFWTAKYLDNDLLAANKKPEFNGIANNVKALMNGFQTGTSRLVVGGNSLLITTNIYPAHPYQVILDTQDKTKNDNRAFYESQFQHNFGQRAMYDGSDFVVMENRDHDVSVTLAKLSPNEVLPLKNKAQAQRDFDALSERKKNEGHAFAFTDKLYSVYSHTNFGNNTYIELGNVEKGLDDSNGYLVLFASERDWDNKMSGYNHNNDKRAPIILSPRDIGLVHVKKGFDTADSKVNWLNEKGDKSQCPATVDNSNAVNSIGETKTVTYPSANDGWDWNDYGCPKGALKCDCRDAIKAGMTSRTLKNSGVKWVTEYGKNYTTKAEPFTEFVSVSHPKLVRIAANTYIALWEESIAEYTIGPDNNRVEKQWGIPEKGYLATKAAKITLVNKNGQVEIQSSAIQDLGGIRLMPGDDAFVYDGKAAWVVGDAAKGKLVLYTVGADLKPASFDLDN